MPTNNASPLSLIIADDHEIFRDGFKILLNKLNMNLNLVGEAANGKELVALTLKHRPHLIITDILMPEMDGIEATRIIHKKDCGIIPFKAGLITSKPNKVAPGKFVKLLSVRKK